MALATDLISHYVLESDFTDGVGSNDLTKGGTGGAHVAGKLGNCWDNTETCRLEDATFTGHETDGTLSEMTIDCWFNFQSIYTTGTARIIDRRIFGLTNNAGTMYLNFDLSNKKFTFQFYDQSISSTVSSTPYDTLPSGIWVHVLIWYDQTEFGIVVDNSDIATSVHSGMPAGTINANGNFCIMGAYGSSGYLDHFMDNVGVWDRKLTEAERDTRYNAGTGLAYPFPTPGKPNILIW